MKKIKTGAICLLTISLLTGCSQSAPLIKSYTDTALNSKSLIINTSTENAYTFFAENLAVFPKNTSSVSSTDNTGETDEAQTDTSESETDETKKRLPVLKPNQKQRRLMKHPKVS